MNLVNLKRGSQLTAALLVGAAVVVAARANADKLVPLVAAARDAGPTGPLIFVAIYALAVVVLIPASWMTMAGGAVFGIVPAAGYALVAATLGSTAAFLIGRYLARGVVARHLDAMPRFSAIDRAVSADGRRIIMLLRLSPVTPFNFLNYALGLTAVSVQDFVVGSVGMVPGAFMYAYAGSFAGHAVALAEQATVPRDTSYYAMLAVGLLATVTATVLVARAAGRALRDV